MMTPSLQPFGRRALVEAITTAEQRQRLEELCVERAEVRVLREIMGPAAMLEWLHTIGVCSDPGLGELSPALPPMSLRQIVAAPEPEVFLWTGLLDVTHILSLYFKHRHDVDPKSPSVLDFGAGCGRLVRFLDRWPGAKAFASDVNPDHVRWCREHLTGTITKRNEVHPPLPFEDGSFHLVYALSVFTHLPESTCFDFLSDIARVLSPFGILVVTTHGREALQIIESSRRHQEMFEMNAGDARAILECFGTEAFVFRPLPRAVLDLAKAGADYGHSFITPEYIRARFDNEHFAVVEHIPGGLRGWQDLTVLRRRERAASP